jgi:pyridoxal phosphate enzyme (YggS family)
MGSIRAGLDEVRERIERACARAGRSASEVTLVAVSKTQPAAAVREAYAAGQRVFGENYVQELVEKAGALADLDGLRWHFIGHLQRNKVKDVVRVGAMIETVDSERLAAEIDKRAASTRVLLQVNVAGEAQKSGCSPEELDALVPAVRALQLLERTGLMTVPPLGEAPEASRPHFARLRELAQRHALKELSMGMSADLEVAIEEGATLVRVGTAIFGSRSPG